MFVELSGQTINADRIVRVEWNQDGTARVVFDCGGTLLKKDDAAKLKSAMKPPEIGPLRPKTLLGETIIKPVSYSSIEEIGEQMSKAARRDTDEPRNGLIEVTE